jgi:hypothetical protein
MRIPSFCLAILIIVALSSNAQQLVIPPVESKAFAELTSYGALRSFLSDITGPVIRVDSIASTKQGRGVFMAKISSSVFGADGRKLRVLLFAQQHGDEPSGKEAVTLLLAKFASGEHGRILRSLDVLIIPQMNPDGSELGQRRTSDSVDLNRNHVLLTSPETKALHDVFDSWKPDVTVDIHEYGSFSSSWSDSGFIKVADVQLGMLTHPNTAKTVHDLQHDSIYPFIASAMAGRGYSFQEYIVGSPDSRIRHSTTEINDGRQSFGILGTVSFIQEGRKWETMEAQLERRAKSQLASIEALLDYCAGHVKSIKRIVQQDRARLASLKPGESLAMRMEHFSAGGTLRIPILALGTQRESTWTVTPYHEKVRVSKSALSPQGYVIPGEETTIIDLLKRHHVATTRIRKATRFVASRYVIDSVGFEVAEEETLPRPYVTLKESNVMVRAGDVMVRTKQLHSVFLPILLEPESQWGLMKYPQLGVSRNGRYPVLRIP